MKKQHYLMPRTIIMELRHESFICQSLPSRENDNGMEDPYEEDGSDASNGYGWDLWQ